MADYEYLNNTGTIVPQTSDILAEVQAEYVAAFGSDLSLAPNTPQGLLITAEVLARSIFLRNNAALANQINPNLAGGVFLDAIAALTALMRSPATSSTSTANLTGVAGTIVPQYSKIQDGAGNIWLTQSVITLTTETVNVPIAAENTGPIAAAANTINTIIDGVIGWETVTNPTDAVLGKNQQSDEAFRLLRQQTLALQGTSFLFAIKSTLLITPGVTSVSLLENVANTTQVISGVTMLPHSMYACVSGGTDLDVATVLLQKKSGGCGYSNGAATPVTVNVTDPSSNQVYPVSFDRPTQVGILIQVYAHAQSPYSDPTTTIQNAILAYTTGQIDGELGWVIGSSASPFELAGAITTQAPGIYVKQVLISLISPVNYSTDEIILSVYQQAYTQTSFITVILS